MSRQLGQRVAFWGAVFGVAVLAPVFLQIAAARFPLPGLSRLAAFANTNTERGQ